VEKEKWRNLPIRCTRKSVLRADVTPCALGALIHIWVRRAIETAVKAELVPALGTAP
jgi:hypothetical protein